MRPNKGHYYADAKIIMNISKQRHDARIHRQSYPQHTSGNNGATMRPALPPTNLARPASFYPTPGYQHSTDIGQRKVASPGNPDPAIDQRLQQRASCQYIPGALTNLLNRLRDYHIVLIINDNDSMAQNDPGLVVTEQGQQRCLTRFEWLKMRLASVIPLLACVADQGLTIKALNHQEMVIDKSLLPGGKELRLFYYLEQLKPGGNTSLLNTLRDQFDRAKLMGTPTTTYVLTDGDSGSCGFLSSQMAAFGLLKQFRMQARGDFFPMSVMACTGDQNQLACMNIIGRSVECLRISNDYHHEAAEAVNAHGPINFSHGIHNVAFLLGAIEPLFNKLDVDLPLTMEELAMLSGREVSEREYDIYTTGRCRFSRQSISLPISPLSGNQPLNRKTRRNANSSCNIL